MVEKGARKLFGDAVDMLVAVRDAAGHFAWYVRYQVDRSSTVDDRADGERDGQTGA